MSWLSDRRDEVSKGLSDASKSVSGSLDSVADSSGDFLRAAGRGDIAGMGEDLLSIGSEVTNIMTGGTLNIAFDAFRRMITPEVPEADYQNRKNTINSASAPRRMVYGKVRAGGVARYAESSGTNDKYLHLIQIFAAHSCEAVEEIYFNDELAFIGTTAQGKFVGKASAIIETGKQTTANAAIVADTPSNWTDDHKLLGQTYVYFKLEYNTEIFQGVPRITAVIKGKDDIVDVRTGSIGWTDNQALCILDYIQSDYGFRSPDSEINMESFKEGADVADELVAAGVGITEKRYTINGTISVIDQPVGPLDNMMLAGMSGLQYVQGQFVFIPGIYKAPESQSSLGSSDYTFDSTTQFTFDSTVAPTFDHGFDIDYKFTDSDLIGGISYTPSGDVDSRVNAVRGTYIDPEQGYEAVDFVQLNVPAYETQDKEILFADTKFQFVDSGTKARRLSKLFLERSRYGVRLSVKFKVRALEFSVGDRIEFESVSEGLINKVYRIDELTPSLDGVEVALSEDAPEVWSWEEGDALVVTPPPVLNLPNPNTVAVPTGLTVSESVYIGNDQTSIKSRVTIDWDNDDVIQRWEVLGFYYPTATYALASTQVVTNSFVLDDAQLGNWFFYVRAVNGIGSRSAYATAAFTTNGKTTAPAAITGFAGTRRPNGVDINWIESAEQDVSYYEVRNGADWASGTPIRKTDSNGFLWEPDNQTVSTLWVKAIDKSGGESATATSLTVGTGATAITSSTGPIVNNKVSFADDTSGYYLGDEEFLVGNASTYLSFSPATQFDLVTPELTITGGNVDFSGTISTSDGRFEVNNTGDVGSGSTASVCKAESAAGVALFGKNTGPTGLAGLFWSSGTSGALTVQTTNGSNTEPALTATAFGTGSAIYADSSVGIGVESEGQQAGGKFSGRYSGVQAISTNTFTHSAGDAALIIDTVQNKAPHIQMLTEHTTFPAAQDGAIILGKTALGVNSIYVRIYGTWHKMSVTGSAADGEAIF